MDVYCYKCDCGFELAETANATRWRIAELHQETCKRNYSHWIETKEGEEIEG